MALFKDLNNFMDEGLTLPVNGKDYTVPEASAELGLRVTRFITLAKISAHQPDRPLGPEDEQVLSDVAERDLYQEVLGDTYQELLDDGVAWAKLKHVALTALFWISDGENTALKYWESAGKVPAPNRAGRRMATRTRTGAAATTPSRTSRTGTTTRKASIPKTR